MIIYKDIVNGDELFSDIFKLATEDEDFIICVHAKMETRKIGGGISAEAIGANPSTEEGGEEGVEDAEQMESKLDVQFNHNVTEQSEFFPNKKAIQAYLKKYVKRAADKLQEINEAKCEKFKKACGTKLKGFLDKWSDASSVYSGERFDLSEADCGIMIGVWSEDGMSVTLYGLRDCMEEEKC